MLPVIADLAIFSPVTGVSAWISIVPECGFMSSYKWILVLAGLWWVLANPVTNIFNYLDDIVYSIFSQGFVTWPPFFAPKLL